VSRYPIAEYKSATAHNITPAPDVIPIFQRQIWSTQRGNNSAAIHVKRVADHGRGRTLKSVLTP